MTRTSCEKQSKFANQVVIKLITVKLYNELGDLLKLEKNFNKEKNKGVLLVQLSGIYEFN